MSSEIIQTEDVCNECRVATLDLHIDRIGYGYGSTEPRRVIRTLVCTNNDCNYQEVVHQ